MALQQVSTNRTVFRAQDACSGRQVKASFRPEFVNRVDEFVVFEALKLNEIRQIVRLQAKRVEARLAEKKIKLQLDDSAVEYLAVRLLRGGLPPCSFKTRALERWINLECLLWVASCVTTKPARTKRRVRRVECKWLNMSPALDSWRYHQPAGACNVLPRQHLLPQFPIHPLCV